jgi:hypothetical protein
MDKQPIPPLSRRDLAFVILCLTMALDTLVGRRETKLTEEELESDWTLIQAKIARKSGRRG